MNDPALQKRDGGKLHLPFLDGVRGIAILAVFLFHCLDASFGHGHLPWKGLFPDFDTSPWFLALYPLSYGAAGVAVFFVVSGFCIHLSYRRSADGWVSFFFRRFFRIYPPYLAAVLLFFFVWPWGTPGIETLGRLKQLVSHLLVLHNWNHWTFFGINPSFWSIAVEVQLYLIYPLLIILGNRLGMRGAMVIAGVMELGIHGAGVIFNLRTGGAFPVFVAYSPFAFWLSWSLGAYLCECFLENRGGRIFSCRFDVVLLAAFAMPLFKLTVPFAFLAFSFATAIAIERMMTGKWSLPKNRVLRIGWNHLGLLGVVSYSFYLFHQPFLFAEVRALRVLLPSVADHPFLLFLACVALYPVVLLVAGLSYKLIELPSISRGKVLWRKLSGKPARAGLASGAALPEPTKPSGAN